MVDSLPACSVTLNLPRINNSEECVFLQNRCRICRWHWAAIPAATCVTSTSPSQNETWTRLPGSWNTEACRAIAVLFPHWTTHRTCATMRVTSQPARKLFAQIHVQTPRSECFAVWALTNTVTWSLAVFQVTTTRIVSAEEQPPSAEPVYRNLLSDVGRAVVKNHVNFF